MLDSQPEPWAVYCRISYVRRTDGQVDTLGVDRQRPPAEKLVTDNGGTVAKVFIDNDISAYSGRYREDYEEMLTWARDGRVRGIAAWAADRLTRRPTENEALIELAERYGVKLLTCTGQYDLGTPSGRLHFRLLGSIARYESEHRAERLRLKHDEVANDGKPHGGGTRPLGFLADRVTHDPEEAPLLREAAERLLAGATVYEVLADWKARGVPPNRGPLPTTSLRRALLSPRTVGMRQHRGVVLGKATWEPIISMEDQQRLAALFSGRDRKMLGAPPKTLLGGILRCVCGMTMQGGIDKRGPVYKCNKTAYRDRSCGKVRIGRERLNEFITELVLDRLTGPSLARMVAALAGDDPNHAELAAQIETDETALAELERDRYQRRDASGRPLVSPQTYPKLREEIQARIDQTRRRMRPRPEARVLMDLQKLGERLRAAWNDDFTLEQQRGIIRACFAELVILPARPRAPRRFDQGRVRRRWVDQRPDDS